MKIYSVLHNIFQVLFWINTLVIISAEIPSDVKKCHFGDVECIAQSVNYVLHNYPKGNEAMGLIPVGAVEVFNVTVAKADLKSPMQINLFFTHLTAHGLEKATVERIVGFEKDISNSKFEVYATVPDLRVVGEYEATGKILVLPLSGGGNAKIDLIDTKFAIRLRGKEEIRNGKRYAKITKVKVAVEPKKITFDMENLFKDNKEMSTSINDLMNKNWADVWNTLQEGVEDLLAELLQKLLKVVLEKQSYDEMFLTD